MSDSEKLMHVWNEAENIYADMGAALADTSEEYERDLRQAIEKAAEQPGVRVHLPDDYDREYVVVMGVTE